MNELKPSGLLDQLLRQTRQHHVQLSSMADLKANMLLTMSSLIVTVALPHLNGAFALPLALLLGFCLLTIVLAAYATMPKLPGKKSRTQSDNPLKNLLFFGDFSDMEYDDYREKLTHVLADPNRAYEIQIREIYTLGKFLDRSKYRYLRLAYSTFILGLICCGVAVVGQSL